MDEEFTENIKREYNRDEAPGQRICVMPGCWSSQRTYGTALNTGSGLCHGCYFGHTAAARAPAVDDDALADDDAGADDAGADDAGAADAGADDAGGDGPGLACAMAVIGSGWVQTNTQIQIIVGLQLARPCVHYLTNLIKVLSNPSVK